MDIGGQTGSSSRRRFSREWFEEVRLDGDWVQPRFWRDPCYLTASPWPKKDLSLAFAALRRVYPPEVAREIFSGSQPRLRGLLIDPMAPFTSALLFFGLDAAAARVWKFPDLVGRLRSDEHFHHARLEVEVMAALLRSRVAFAYEPLRGRPENPDFSVTLGSREVLLEAKRPKQSRRVADEDRWFNAIFYGPRSLEGSSWLVDMDLETLDAYVRLLDSDRGRRFLEDNHQALAQSVRYARHRLLAIGRPGATTTVKGLFRLSVPHEGRPRGVMGAPTNGHIEAERIVRGCLADAVAQIPSARDGLVLIEPGFSAPLHEMVASVNRWLVGPEGRGYPNILGTLIVSPVYFDRYSVRRITPVWRNERTRRTVARSQFLDRFATGLNWNQLFTIAWQEEQQRTRA